MNGTRRAAFILMAGFLLSACKKDEISSYQSGGSGPTPAPMGAPFAGSGAMDPAMAGSVAPPPLSAQMDISWKVPQGWREEAPSAMRAGSFSAAGKDGLKADISVVVLAGDAGGDLANVNRWRGQLNLEPIGQEQLGKNLKGISPGGRKMSMVNVATTELFIDNRYRKRLVAVIYPRGGRTWFFKMTGEDALVSSLLPSFQWFLEHLSFRDSGNAS